jgi:Carboxypeptidase regulatory-like domain
MRFNRLQNAVLGLSLLAVAGFVASNTAMVANAQSAVTGAVSGTVSDGSGAVVPGATVVVIDTATDSKQVVKSNAEGRYTVGLLKPGLYKVTASAESLKSDTLEVTVILGTTVPADIKVTPTGSNTVIEVTSTALPLVDTQNVALATTFTEQQIQDLPTPGGDVTTVAFTAPGVVVNAGGAYGNFSSDGLPGISNLFVLNGFDNQDPFLNLNNSGSSNLTLGQGELAEATVVQNGYNSQYGRAAGAVINYTTKSGTNRFHGTADYNYNGTVLNSNGWFNGLYGLPRPHAVSNEWALNGGGPIIKDKLFFFSDYEGLRYVLPGASGLINFPSAAFQSAALANVAALPGAQSTYAQAFAAYQGAASYGSATALPTGDGTPAQVAAGTAVGGGCGGMSGTAAPGGGYWGEYPTGVTSGTLVPCMTEAAAQVNNINKEWLYTQRVDWNINDKHKIYGRYKMDHGSQPTGTSFISPLFSTVSIQPEYEGQFNDSYVISPTKTNVFVAAANWYTAYFGPADVGASQALFPWNATLDAGSDNSGNVSAGATGLASLGVPYYFPQGRNVTQYQLEDDFSWIHGKHTFKFGANFRRDLVEDYDAQVLTDYPLEVNIDLPTLYSGNLNLAANGFTGEYIQNYITQNDAHLALYNLGAYAQDEFQASPKLKLTLGVRVDRTGNPLCHGGCFSLYNGSFPNSNASVNEPYNLEIDNQNWHPFPKVQFANIQPRFGFNYSIDDKTEIRGGVGLFSDLYPAGFLDGVIQNFPNDNSVTVYTGNISAAGNGSLNANAAAGNAAIASGFAGGQSVSQIATALGNQGIPFTPPALGAYFPSTFKVPEYAEYSLQFQRQLTRSEAIVITYAGNYGYNGVLINPNLNASDGFYGNGPSLADPWGAGSESIGGLPVTPPDPSFAKVSAFTNNGHSNYNGGMISYKHNGHGLTGQVSYTYSHSLDMVSNGGEGENFNGGSVTTQLTPTIGPGNLNYSNSDYDIRNNLVGDVVYEEPFKFGNKILNEIGGGWTIGAKTYYRGGEPFSIYDLAQSEGGYTNLGGPYMVNALAPTGQLTNTTGSNPHAAVAYPTGSTNPGLDATQYSDPTTTFGNLRRNSLYGPHYADTDLSVAKKIVKAEGFTFSIGANAYNAFNNVNFSNPASTYGSGSFGLITGTNAPPTSPYGSFQGAAVTQRVLQVHGKITF